MGQFALMEIGSNSIHFVVYEAKSGHALKKTHHEKVHAYLIDELTVNNDLTMAGMRKLIHILSDLQSDVNEYKVNAIELIGTAVMRQAVNKAEIMEAIQRETGLVLKVLSEKEEAYYGFQAVQHSLCRKDALIVDVGGGSTEVTLMREAEFMNTISFPFGARNVLGKVSDDASTNDMEAFLSVQFSKHEWIRGANLPIIAIGGSAHNIVRMIRNYSGDIESRTHGYTVSGRDLEILNERLSKMKEAEILQVDGLSKKRKDTIMPAMQIFRSLYAVSDATAFIHGRQGVREGMALEHMRNK